MADEIKTVKKTQDYEEIYIEKGFANDDPNYYVGFNGKNYILPKGKTSKVPKAVADEIRRAREAQTRLDARVDELIEKSK